MKITNPKVKLEIAVKGIVATYRANPSAMAKAIEALVVEQASLLDLRSIKELAASSCVCKPKHQTDAVICKTCFDNLEAQPFDQSEEVIVEATLVEGE